MSLLTDFSGGGSGGYAIAEWGEYDNTKYMEVDQTSIIKPTLIGEWTYKSPMPVAADSVSAVAISSDDYLVLIDGTMYRYTPSVDTFTEDTNYTLTHHHGTHMVVYNDGVGDFVYIFGGYGADNVALDLYSVFDVTNGTYTDNGSMLLGTLVRSSACMSVSEGGSFIYIYGGLINDVISGSLWAYDIVENTFSEITGGEVSIIISPRFNHFITIYNDILYIFGGVDDQSIAVNTVLKFDTNNLALLPNAKSGGISGNIIGGFVDFGWVSIVSDGGVNFGYDINSEIFYKRSNAFYDVSALETPYKTIFNSFYTGSSRYGYVFGGRDGLNTTDNVRQFDNYASSINQETKVLISKV